MKTEKETWKLFLMRAAILLVMMLTMTVQTAWADAGATTTHFTWAYVESTQTLTITRGSTDGEMGNVPTNASRPWESYKNSIQHLVIGAGVTHIGQRDFQSHTALQDVTFEEGCTLEAIRDYAFDGCTSLTSITLPEGLTTITSYAFYNTGLTSVTIPSTMTRIYPHAFENCTSLTSVTMNVVDPATLTLSDDSFQSGVTVYVMYNVDAWNTKFPSTYHCNFTEMASDTWESGDTDVKLYANGTMFVSKKAGDGDGASIGHHLCFIIDDIRIRCF